MTLLALDLSLTCLPRQVYSLCGHLRPFNRFEIAIRRKKGVWGSSYSIKIWKPAGIFTGACCSDDYHDES